jgi:hypothetical protein
MKKRSIVIISLVLLFSLRNLGQVADKTPVFTHADTVRGSISPERAWWDVLRYDIAVKPDYNDKTISGSCQIKFRIIPAAELIKKLKNNPGRVLLMQIDLQAPLIIDSIIQNQAPCKGKSGPAVRYQDSFSKKGNNFYYVTIKACGYETGERLTDSVLIYYHGSPHEATNPPWDGGWIFTKDKLGRPWMTVACQGVGASIWYPCKDHQSDEPDSGASLRITVPDTLVAVGNGRLKEKIENSDGTTSYKWEVVNPINNYDIIPYIGKYKTWHSDYQGEKGKLDCDFWVIDYELARAKLQFLQVDSMLHCFEYWLGPYPFYEDGYKLVQAPHLGMEHQSAVAYGNKFQNGYLGRDLSGTGWGLLWDFIIVHESGHEWFGNNITTNDLADMWVHEGFTNYSETLYTTCQDGVEAGNAYCIGTRKRIRNDKPIIAHYGVNEKGSDDMYYKGGNMLHTIRQVINDDEKFRQIWRGLNKEFYHKTVTSRQIENYISEKAHIDFSRVFDQYLRTTRIPILEFKTDPSSVSFRWTNCVKGFNLPVKVNLGTERWIKPTEEWTSIQTGNDYDGKTFIPDKNFYIQSQRL